MQITSRRKKYSRFALITAATPLVFLFLLFHLSAFGVELAGNIVLEGRYFPDKPQYPAQQEHNASVVLEPELYHAFTGGSSVLLKSFVRLDSNVDERTHWDIREASFIYPTDDWELQVGISKVFWGATEFVHLVDIINQTDSVEDFTGEEKLGQPMLHLTVPQKQGMIEAFVLPWFRERTFPGEKDRLRSDPIIDTNLSQYESAAEQSHLDFALRYSHTFSNADLGLYHFNGTSREPNLLLGGDMRHPVLFPSYHQIGQTGLDVQMAAGDWLLKGEALYRTGQGRSFAAAVCGFEYTFYGIYESGADLGIIGEYVFDDRADKSLTVVNNDVIGGFRLALNDAAGTEILAGLMKDVEFSTYMFSVEADRRFGEHLKLHMEALFLFDAAEQDAVLPFEQDSQLTVELQYFF
ncbi:hypothetical protein H206_01163 [Candidatus Electrothrix aarhusensis]|uniref:Phosphate-selective porin O and P n=1 Tax=Candidatus Electrothrix aarhusensis TaxID=1859131 RepID=A0A444IW60_9BACT|nr:hypothetical protein H206_01163 [Candidatus Electrothrix aarhusensis]